MTKKQTIKGPPEVWRNLLTPKECLTHFKNRLLIKMRERYDSIRTPDRVNANFALRFGYPVPAQSSFAIDIGFPFTPAFDRSYARQAIVKASSLSEICFAIECLLHSLQDDNNQSIRLLEKAIREAITLSPGIAVDISVHGKEIRVRPAGDPFLDRHLVDEVLVLLENQSAVSKHFKEALRIFASGEASRYRNALDNLRFALEALLKKALGNSKSLENQKPALLPWLRDRGVHQQVVNMYEGLLFGPYSTYQNQAVKHNEEFSLVDLEFIIYLTGAFMRLVLVLSREKT